MNLVAFDIETEGFNPLKERITAAAVYGQDLSKVFIFKGEDDLALRDEFLAILDAAPLLCAFNGVRFDIPFIIKSWKLDPALADRWVRKTVDVFEASKLGLQKTFKLSLLLEVNGLESKSGSGAEAVLLAREKKWEELGAYCLQDTRLTYLVTTQLIVTLPNTLVVMDRTCPSMFKLI
jgi:hypothetical protein